MYNTLENPKNFGGAAMLTAFQGKVAGKIKMSDGRICVVHFGHHLGMMTKLNQLKGATGFRYEAFSAHVVGELNESGNELIVKEVVSIHQPFELVANATPLVTAASCYDVRYFGAIIGKLALIKEDSYMLTLNRKTTVLGDFNEVLTTMFAAHRRVHSLPVYHAVYASLVNQVAWAYAQTWNTRYNMVSMDTEGFYPDTEIRAWLNELYAPKQTPTLLT